MPLIAIAKGRIARSFDASFQPLELTAIAQPGRHQILLQLRKGPDDLAHGFDKRVVASQSRNSLNCSALGAKDFCTGQFRHVLPPPVDQLPPSGEVKKKSKGIPSKSFRP